MGANEKMLSDALGCPPEERCPVCGFKADHAPEVHRMKPREVPSGSDD